MMKKVLRWMAAWLLIVGIFPHGQAAAVQSPVITGDTVTSTAGQIVDYQVRLTSNPGLSSFKIRLEYDTEVLSVITREAEKEIECEAGSVTANRGSFVSAVCEGGCQVFWYSTEDVDEDGILFSVPLRIAEDAPEKAYPVTVTYDGANTTNGQGDRVRLECVNGSVTVRAWEPTIICTASGQVKLGETFECTVSLQDNPGIASCNVQLVFDSQQFELVKDDSGQVRWSREGVFQAGTVEMRAYSNAVNVFWYQTADSHGSGPVLRFTLRAKETAVPGKASVSLICQKPENIVNAEEIPVAFACQGCNVELLSAAEADITLTGGIAAVRLKNAGFADKAITAFYGSDGKMLRVVLMTLTDGAANTQVALPTGEIPSLCKTVLLDRLWVPLDSRQTELN